MLRVGVLAYQGGVEEHVYMVQRACSRLGLECSVALVKKPRELTDIDAIILPGGESTTIAKLAVRLGVFGKLRELIASGLPVLGTCAGAIMLARKVRDRVVGETGQPILGLMDVEVVRNYFGRQRDSFELDLEAYHPLTGRRRVRGVFIRAPAITRLWGRAKPIATIHGGIVAAAYQDNMVATVFHPELAGETMFHEILLAMAKGRA
jgi:5'-phosphate synthase pdxT subunit